MTAEDLTKELVRATGDINLVVDYAAGNFADAGAYAYLNKGLHLLDAEYAYLKPLERRVFPILLGEYYKSVGALEIDSVSMLGTDSRYYELNKLTKQEARTSYTEPFATLAKDEPDEWYFDPRFCAAGDGITYVAAVVFLPPSVRDTSMQIEARFASPAYTLAASTDFWSSLDGDLVVYAAQICYEEGFLNKTGISALREVLQRRAVAHDIRLAAAECMEETDGDFMKIEG